jgi:hypothetical protein
MSLNGVKLDEKNWRTFAKVKFIKYFFVQLIPATTEKGNSSAESIMRGKQ